MIAIAKLNRIFAMEWSRLLQYRLDLVLWMVSEAALPLISLAIWHTVALTSQTGPGPREIFTYYIFIIFVMAITNAWGGFFLSREILEGEIVQYLTRPMSIFWKYIANNLNEKLIKLLIPLPILLVSLVIFKGHFTPAIFQTNHIVLFTVSLIIGIILHFNLDMVFGTFAFWLEDAMQIRQYNEMLASIASGVMIPFALMPSLARQIFSFLPFRYYISLPIELLLGQVQGAQALLLISYQIAWTIVLVILLAILWKKGLHRYAPPGQ